MKKIVLADDNRTFLMYIGLLLKRLGYQLFTARNGVEALSIININTVDLVMLDVHMDTLDGITTLRHIKSDERFTHLPVIMISTDASPETIKTCMDIGCIDYLKKPIKVDLLHNSIEGFFPLGATMAGNISGHHATRRCLCSIMACSIISMLNRLVKAGCLFEQKILSPQALRLLCRCIWRIEDSEISRERLFIPSQNLVILPERPLEWRFSLLIYPLRTFKT